MTGVLVGVAGGMVSVGEGMLLGVDVDVAVGLGENIDVEAETLHATSRTATTANVAILVKN
jgi:hypothetical protein